MKARITAFVGLWLAVAGGIFLAPGCYGRNCEASAVTYGIDGGQGQMVTPDIWESNDWTGEWLSFPRQRYYSFELDQLGNRTPFKITPYLSASPHPSKDGNNAIIGAGNIAEIINVGPNRVTIGNDTCSDYYLRLVLDVPPLPPLPPAGSDAGAP